MDRGPHDGLGQFDPVSPRNDPSANGLDSTLIDEMLRLTPEERLRYHNAVIQFIYEMRRAFEIRSHGISS
jgi:hypothetical protein